MPIAQLKNYKIYYEDIMINTDKEYISILFMKVNEWLKKILCIMLKRGLKMDFKKIDIDLIKKIGLCLIVDTWLFVIYLKVEL